jgi:hypothetical protein
MAPDPTLLRLLAEAAKIAAQHAEHAAALIRWGNENVTPIEGGETIDRAAGDIRGAAADVRRAAQTLLWLAGKLEEERRVTA